MKRTRVPIPIARLHQHSAEGNYTGRDKVFCVECAAFFSPKPPDEPPCIIAKYYSE